jgi:hypothetical protein
LPSPTRRTVNAFGKMLNREETSSYKIDYSRFPGKTEKPRISLKIMVGAARFELTTPCAQGKAYKLIPVN